MDNITSLMIQKSDFDSAHNSLDRAAINFEKVQIEARAASTAFVEKFTLYSGGIISLSVTFVGFIINNNKSILRENIFHIPIIYILFGSWILFMMTLFIGVMLRRIGASYIYYNASTEWFKKSKHHRQKILDLLNSEYPFALRPGQTREELKKTTKKEISYFDKNLLEHDYKENIYLKCEKWAFKIIILTFAFGILLLTIFSICSIYQLIWRQ